MQRIRIYDRSPDHFLGFDAADVLRALGPEALEASWQVAGVPEEDEAVMATGDGADVLEALAASGERVSGSRLLEILTEVHQTIWGAFAGYRADDSIPWVRIVAFDSSWFEVLSADQRVIDAIRSAFRDTTVISPPIP
jgi:hypothetical protein